MKRCDQSQSTGVRLVLASSPAALGAGCLPPDEINAIKSEIDEMEQDLGVIQSEIRTRIETGGGDVNEPITGWIMAAGYASVPATLFLYLLAHRLRLFRKIKSKLRGEHQSQPL